MSTRDVDTGELLEIALAAADLAAALIHDHRPDELQVDQKSSATDHVTDMDLASEALIRSTILDARPDDRIIGEEGSPIADSTMAEIGPVPGVTWIVDPIDGTTNYVYDLPGYNISIAAAVDGEVLVGVVADPAHGRVYRAMLGAGAFCNDTKLRLGERPPKTRLSLERSLIATGFGYSAELRAEQGHVVAKLLPRIRDIRRLGAAALDLCHVASGRVDGYFELNLEPWDVAAGALIATEAGARVDSLRGGPRMPGSVVAAHPDIFEDLQQLLAELGAGEVAGQKSNDARGHRGDGRQ